MLFGIYRLAILALQSNDVTVKGSPLEAEIGFNQRDSSDFRTPQRRSGCEGACNGHCTEIRSPQASCSQQSRMMGISRVRCGLSVGQSHGWTCTPSWKSRIALVVITMPLGIAQKVVGRLFVEMLSTAQLET